ncbi:MAG TPA: FkbM family methyltransferase [Dokdonella sp.]
MRFVQGIAFPEADRQMAADMRADGTYQADHLTAALRHVTDWSCAIDGGAHVGLWTRLMAPRFGRVLAFEPSPDTFECLEANSQGLSNVRCYSMALGDAPGSVSMTWSEACAARANTGGRFVQPGGDIQVITIDSLQLPSLGFLKLDVEGYEPHALAGAVETIARCKPIVLYERKFHWTHNFGLPKNAVTDILGGLGYHELERVGGDAIWGPR